MIIGMASKRAGDSDRAQVELEAARAAFERLGATLDARAAADQLRDASDLPRGLSARELEVLRLLAAGKTNREIAATLIISEHTVSRHVQNIFHKLDVSSRAAATAFAFEHSLV
jgi:DNA-binding NarL/FixJ family response regulator